MSGGALVGFLVLVFFLAGIAVGVVTILAMSARRARMPPEYGWPEDGAEEDQADDPGPDTDGFGYGPGGPRWPG